MPQSSKDAIEPLAALAIAKAISFSHTSKELLSGKKTCTRRIWKDQTALLFTVALGLKRRAMRSGRRLRRLAVLPHRAPSRTTLR